MRLITWNIQWARGIDGRVSPERIAKEALALGDFDVLCLQEVAVNFPGLEGSRGEDQVELLRAALHGYSVHFAAATDVAGARGGRSLFGNLIASRLSVRQVLRHQLPWPADATVPSMARVALEAVVQANSGLVRVTCTHLEYYSSVIRMAQVHALRELHSQACARARAPRPGGNAGDPFQAIPAPSAAVLVGDFNFRPDAPDYTALTAAIGDETPGLLDAWPLANPGRVHPPTFRLHDPHADEAPYCCDFCFVSEDLAPRLQRIAVDNRTQASDHQPLIVEMAD